MHDVYAVMFICEVSYESNWTVFRATGFKCCVCILSDVYGWFIKRYVISNGFFFFFRGSLSTEY